MSKESVLLDISEEDINDISIYTEQDPSIVKLVLRKMLKEYINLIEKEDVIGDSIDFIYSFNIFLNTNFTLFIF
jgi:hypothetical protein